MSAGDGMNVIKDLTEWHIEGELQCPDCGTYFDFDGSKPELDKFISGHACEEFEGDREPAP